MMATREVAAVGGTILQLLDKIQSWGNNYYTASAAWHEFPQNVLMLRAKHASLEAQLERYGLLEDVDPSILEALKSAKQLMLEEVATLEKRRANNEPGGGITTRISKWFKTVGEMLFPAKVGFAVQRAIKAYDDIQGHFTSQQERDQVMKNAIKTKPITLPFGRNCQDNYVQLGCESKIYCALEKSGVESPTVVLLYGASGRGKSTVATQVCLAFQNDGSVFAQVLILECGLEMDAQAKEMELLQTLGWDDLDEMSAEQSNQHGSKVVRSARLQNLLRNQKVLIVLDDLWEPDFLRKLLNLSGPGVKYLITSQRKDLCKNLSCPPGCLESFQVDDLRQDESRAMLAVHIGFANRHIPDHLKEIAGEILHQAEGTPLVIATLGAQIGKSGDIENLEVWRCALESCDQCLNTETPSTFIAGTTYPRSYWSAMKQSIDGLSQKEKHLFLLLGTCKGPSVPQEILQFFCSITFLKEECNVMKFLQWKAELKSRHLVFEKEEKCLSMHSLTKRLVVQNMEDSLGLIVHSLVEIGPDSLPLVSEETRVIILLVCLYLDAEFGKPLALQIGLTWDKITETMRRSIEPVTKLLVYEVISSRLWTGELHICARQVFLEFLCKSSLDDDHISQLLGCSAGIMNTLQFLESAADLEEPFWQKNTISRICFSLLRIFQDTTHPDFQVKAAYTLSALCKCNVQTRDTIVNTSGMLHQLLCSLSQDENPKLQSTAALLVSRMHYFPLHNLINLADQDYNSGLEEQPTTVVESVASTTDSTRDCNIACSPTLLESLAVSLSNARNPVLQKRAASALANLGTGDQSMKKQIINVPSLLDKLVKSLHQDENSGLAKEAARAICCLATINNSTMRGKIASSPNLLQSLGVSLSKAPNPALQKYAAWALANLGCGNQSLKEQIISVPGLLDKLVKSLDQDENSVLAEQAARAISKLAYTDNSTIKDKIVSSPNLLQSIGVSLSKTANPALQKYAAVALANLGYGNQSLKEQIINVPGLLNKLVKSLDQDENSGLAQQAAMVICNLAYTGNSTVKGKIASSPNLLESLAVGLSKAQNLALQENAAWALANLGSGDQSMKKQIINVPGLLHKLVKSLDQDENSGLAKEAARAICCLATINNSTMMGKIASSPNLLQSLGVSLSKALNPALQKYAAWALANLGCGNQSLKEQIINLPRLLNKLVKSLNQDENSGLAEQAARVISKLAYTDNPTMKGKIASFPDLLKSLVVSVSKAPNPALQKYAARALGNLGCGHRSLKEQIINVSGLLDKLVKLLDQDENPGLAEEAARAICKLASTDNSTIKGKIVSSPNLLKSLAVLVSKAPNPTLQKYAARALGNLGCGDQSLKKHVINVPGLLDKLVKSLDQDENSGLAEQAARAICKMAYSGNSTIKGKIASSPNLVKSLVVSVLVAPNPALQKYAAGALGNLGYGNQSLKEQIFNVPGLLDKLVKSLDQDENSGLAEHAARAICKLAYSGNSTIKGKIASSPNLVKSLVVSVSMVPNPALQKYATWALANLGYGNQSLKEHIINVPRLLDKLVKSLDQDENSGLAEQVAMVICNLAYTGNSTVKGKISSSPNLLESLAVGLSKVENRRLRICAAWAVVNLGCDDQSINEQIGKVSGLLDNLVKSMDDGLVEETARFFAAAGASEDSIVRG